MQERLFMNSRDRLAGGPLQEEIERQLEDIIKNHPGLRQLREERRRKDIENKLSDSKPLADVLEKIIKNSPSLTSLFTQGVRILNPFKPAGLGSGSFKGKEFPTYFNLEKEYPEESPKICPINNRRFRIQYKTDANNDYFKRDKSPGELTLTIDGIQSNDYTINLWDGLATLNIGISPNLKIGDVLCFKTEVSDIMRVGPFSSEFCIKIGKAQESGSSENKGVRRESPNLEGEDKQKPKYLDIPNVWEIRKDEWEKHSFDEKSALRVVDTGEGDYDFFINMDNIYLQLEIKGDIRTDPKILEARFKYGMVLFGISILDFEEKKESIEKENQLENNGISVFEKISQFSRALAPTLLPMITALGDLEV